MTTYSNSSSQTELTKLSYRAEVNDGIGVVPATEAIHAEALYRGLEDHHLIGASIFSRITGLSAKTTTTPLLQASIKIH